MRSLYESLFDVEDNIDNVDRVHLIGEEYEIDIKDVRCNNIDKILKRSILKVRPKYNYYQSPKITQFDDKTNKILEVLCNLILNIPIDCLSGSSFNGRKAMMEYTGEHEKTFAGGCAIKKTVGGVVCMSAFSKSLSVKLDNGMRTYATPQIYIPLKKIR
jgi:hypothetical protein